MNQISQIFQIEANLARLDRLIANCGYSARRADLRDTLECIRQDRIAELDRISSAACRQYLAGFYDG